MIIDDLIRWFSVNVLISHFPSLCIQYIDFRCSWLYLLTHMAYSYDIRKCKFFFLCLFFGLFWGFEPKTTYSPVSCGKLVILLFWKYTPSARTKYFFMWNLISSSWLYVTTSGQNTIYFLYEIILLEWCPCLGKMWVLGDDWWALNSTIYNLKTFEAQLFIRSF